MLVPLDLPRDGELLLTFEREVERVFSRGLVRDERVGFVSGPEVEGGDGVESHLSERTRKREDELRRGRRGQRKEGGGEKGERDGPRDSPPKVRRKDFRVFRAMRLESLPINSDIVFLFLFRRDGG